MLLLNNFLKIFAIIINILGAYILHDYDKILEDDLFSFIDLDEISPGKTISMEIKHSNSDIDIINCNHTYNDTQIAWFRAGSALNLIRENER